MKLFLATLLSMSALGWTCEVKIPAKILVISEKVSNLEKLHTKSCQQSELESLYSLIQNSKGRVSLSHLRSQLNIKFSSASPFLEIVHLKDLLRSKIVNQGLRHDYKVVKTPSNQSAFLLNDDQYIKVDCYNCESNSGQSLNYKISFQDSSRKRHKMNLEMIRTQSFIVYRAIRDIPVFKGNLSPNDFESVSVETQRAKNYFDDMQSIGFLKTTRTIKKGDVLLKSHFSYRNIVRMGEVLTIELKSNNISLMTQGKALSRGKINETIQVKSIRSSKIFSAKITEPGKAEVTL